MHPVAAHTLLLRRRLAAAARLNLHAGGSDKPLLASTVYPLDALRRRHNEPIAEDDPAAKDGRASTACAARP